MSTTLEILTALRGTGFRKPVVIHPKQASALCATIENFTHEADRLKTQLAEREAELVQVRRTRDGLANELESVCALADAFSAQVRQKLTT